MRHALTVERRDGAAQLPPDEGGFARSRTFAAACAARGLYLHPHHNWFVSAAWTDPDVDRALEITDGAFAEVARSPEHRS